MNKTFKVIFNHALGRHVVVSEIASSIQRGACKALLAVAVTVGIGSPVWAQAIMNGAGASVDGETASAFGSGTSASGSAATAFGVGTKAEGAEATAFGYKSEAIGIGTTAWGNQTRSAAYVINENGYVKTTNGYATLDGKKAYSVGDTTFKVTGSNRVQLDVLVDDSDHIFAIDRDEEGTKHKYEVVVTDGKAKFKKDAAGNRIEVVWTASSDIGERQIRTDNPYLNSTAWGQYAIAANDEATAFGASTAASGRQSTAFGEGTIASGSASTAFGQSTAASGTASTSFDQSTTASGDASTAFGIETVANGMEATAFGYRSQALGGGTTAWGNQNTAAAYVTDANGYVKTDKGVLISTSSDIFQFERYLSVRFRLSV